MEEIIGKKFRQIYQPSNILSAWEDTVQSVSVQYITFEHTQKENGITKRRRCLQPQIIIHGYKHSCKITDAVFIL